MNNTSKVINHDGKGRLARRIVFGVAVLAAVAAVVVLGDNGVPTGARPGQVPWFTWADKPSRTCQLYFNAIPEPPENPNLAFFQARAIRGPVRGQTNTPPDLDTNAPPDLGTNGPFNLVTNVACSVTGVCTNRDGNAVQFSYKWCCDAGTSCFVQAGAGWLTFSNWLHVNLGGQCLDSVGCR